MKILIPMVENEVKNKMADTVYCTALYEINRKTILQHIIEALVKIREAEFIFILNKSNVEKYHLDSVIKLLLPQAEIVVAQGQTKGSACSCLLGIDYFKPEESLIIVGGDQLVTIDLQEVVDFFVQRNYDGGVICFEDIHPRWSYVRLNDEGMVTEAAEKRPISNHATTGFYYFKRTSDFVESAFQMIKKNAGINGNFYVCPAYNEMILEQKEIGVYHIKKEQYFNFSHIKGIELYEEYCKKCTGGGNVT